MKYTVLTICGTVGAYIASLFGGWSAALTTLCIVMAIDYGTGIAVAICHKSQKTETGGLRSDVGFRGILKKCIMLALVLMAYRLDIVVGSAIIKDGVCTALIANECLSIIENAGLMGIPIPSVITRAIDVLKNNSDK